MNYEYKKYVGTTITEEHLNQLGKEGWDNYAISGNVFYFKRPVGAFVEQLETGKAKSMVVPKKK